MKSIIIHIGGHKTGSTAIQKMVFRNKELMKTKGWLFPGHVHAHNTIGEELKRGGGNTENFDNTTFLEHAPFTKKIIDEINKSGEDRVIISAEYFEHLPKRGILSLKTVLDKAIDGDRKYIIIYYCRRQDFFLESLYRERIKIDFLEGNFPSPAFAGFKATSPLRNYYGILDTWASVFGKENIIVQAYEKEQMKKDIFSDFFGKIDLQFTDEFQYPSEEDSNIGLSVDLTEFLRLASSSPQTDQKFRNNLYRILVKLNIDNKKLKKRDYLSPEERREILIQCEKTNQRVAREYLGREDGKLFLEPWPDPDDSWEPYEGLSIEEIIPIFTRVLHKMHQDFNKNVHIFQREQDLIQKMSNWKKKLLSGIFPP